MSASFNKSEMGPNFQKDVSKKEIKKQLRSYQVEGKY